MHGAERGWESIETVLCDLDGVVWLAHDAIAGSVEAIAVLRGAGRRVVFVTNNSMSTMADHVAALAAIGVPAEGDVVSSAMAAAHLVPSGRRVLVTAGPGVVEAFRERGAEVVVNDGQPVAGPVDAVVVGLDRRFDYQRLVVAARAIRAGARLIGTNTDSTFPTPEGLLPGGGSILAAVVAASGAVPTIGGKPHQPMADLIADLLATPDRPFDPDRVLMVGDRPETDGLFAARLGCRFALVRTGVPTTVDTASVATVDLDVADLAEVGRILVPAPSSIEEPGE